jgi:hypothetical protein
MKKLVLLVTLVFALGGTSFAQDDRGAIGFGVTVQSSQTSTVSNNLRFNLFLDVGTRLYGPFFYGFEMAGDFSQLSQLNFNLTQTDVTAYSLGGGQWVEFYDDAYAQATYTLWDLDISPRAYLSFDVSRNFQLLGFAGFNYNWQSLDYTLKNTGTNPWTASDGSVLYGGQSVSTSTSLPGTWAAVVGFRVSVALLYLDYTRYLPVGSSALDVDNYDVNRISLGLSLRF